MSARRLQARPRRGGSAPQPAPAWQLIVHDSGEMAEMVIHTLAARLQAGGRASCAVHARNIADAQAQLAERGAATCSLVVVGSATPQDANAPVALAGREPMQRFVEELKRARPGLPLVVIAATPDQRLAGFLAGFDAAALVRMDSQFSVELARRVGEFHGEAAAAEGAGGKAAGRLRLDLHLSGKQCRWEITRSGDDPFSDDGDLYIDDELMERVLFLSEELERRILADHLLGHKPDGRWLRSLQILAQDLNRLIFDGSVPNINCWETFLTHRERAGGIDRARIHVTVDDKTHPLLVEALRDRSASEPEYWMLRAPVLRRYQHAVRRRPLFKDAERRADPINCLIVEADPRAGNLPEYDAILEALPHCRAEAEGIVKLLRAAGFRKAAKPDEAAEAPGCFEHLRLATARGDLREVLARKLKERPWQLVHFCGHVVASDGQPPGLVLVPEPGGVLPMAALAAQLGGAQFVYLSSCRSASAKVVLQAVEQFVPAVLGFQWIVEDEAAASFARAFYAALFDKGGTGYRYLEYAFLKARRALYERDPHKPAWVAPALVMQME